MKKIYISLSAISLFILCNGYAQHKELSYSVDLQSNVSTENTLPFWMVANKFGAVPNNNNGILSFGLFKDFDEKSYYNHGISYGIQTSASIADKNDIIINQLYLSFKLNKLQLDLGSKYDEIKWEGLSSSNGNFIKSTNSRAYPGYNFQLIDYVKLPFAKSWLSFKASYGDYLMNDKRFVDNTRLHHKSLYFKSKLNQKLDLIVGLDHYAQWGGTSLTTGKQPSGFKDYIKIITGKEGGSNASGGDQINALGNHVGAYLVQLDYKGEKTNWNFYWSHPFEDRSGRELTNYPDALYGLFIDFKKPEAVITHLLTEVTYTKDVSGDAPHYVDEQGVAHAASGRDEYFNNGVYRSGWTYFGDIIGTPYFTPKPEVNGITEGTILQDNRFLALNLGFKGNLKNVQYKTILSYTTYYGWFEEEYDPNPKQFSGLFEFYLPEFNQLPFNISLGAAFDTGTYRPDNFGGYIKLTKNGIF
jgi:hypothetical protein